jgi:beta-galactosidase
MHGGEEQYLQGMVEWDGVPNRKYAEYREIAVEFAKIEKHGFPYAVRAEVGLAFCFASQIASGAFPERHDLQVQRGFEVLWELNVDSRVIDLGQSNLEYKLLLILGTAVLSEGTARKLRTFVEQGGTVVMTAGSALVDEHGRVVESKRPAFLADVFGIRLAGFEEPSALNEISPAGLEENALCLRLADQSIATDSLRFDVIEATSADVIGTITSLHADYPIITSHRYGNGTAIYVGLPAKTEVLRPLVRELITRLAIDTGPARPDGVVARQIDDRHVLYLNTTMEPKVVKFPGQLKSLLRGTTFQDEFTLSPAEPEFIEVART